MFGMVVKQVSVVNFYVTAQVRDRLRRLNCAP